MAPPPPRQKRSVSVPIKIRVTGDRIDGDRMRDHIADRAGSQLGRAFDVLDEHGDWQPTLSTLDVTFTGAAARLSDEDKRALHAKVSDGLAQAAKTAGAGRGARGKSTPKAAATKAQKPSKARPTKLKVKTPLAPVATWHPFGRGGDDVFNRAFDDAALQWMLARGADAFPTTYGILFRLKGVPEVQLWVVSGGAYVCRRSLTVVNWTSDKPTHEPAKLTADRNDLYLELERDGLKKWRESAYKRAEDQRGAKEKGKVTAELDINEPQAKHTSEAHDAVDAYTKDWETSILVYYWLHVGGGGIYPFTRADSPNMPIQDRIELVALVDVALADQGDKDEDGGATGPELPPDDGGGGGDQGKGTGDGSGGTGSDITAPPGQDVGAGGRGIVIAPEYKPGGSIFPILPPDPNADPLVITCQPYQGEPSVDQLGAGGQAMKRLIAEIAARLDMPPCEYPAHFCISSMHMIRVRTSQVQGRFELDASGQFTAELAVGTVDNAGTFSYRAIDSQAVQYLQHLAATVPKIRKLMDLVRIHTYPLGRFAPHHWFEKVMDEATQACGLIWLVANQVMMQQLLNSSRYTVQQRQHNPDYPHVFEVMLRTHLAEQVELIMLRNALEQFTGLVGNRRGNEAYEYVRQHMIVQQALSGALSDNVDVRKETLLRNYGRDADLVTRLSDDTDYVFRRGRKEGVADIGAIIEVENPHAHDLVVIPWALGPTWAIRASDGKLYRKDELDQLIKIREQVAVSIDPLISQLLHRLVSAVRPLVEDPTLIPPFLDKLFTDMLSKNTEVSGKNRASIEYAFKHAQIHRVDRSSPPAVQIADTQVMGWSLSGVHALAHSHVGVFFESDAFYTAALDRLIGQEYYWRSFVEDMVFVFGIALSIICPPVGAAVSFAANLALGISAYRHAKEQETIYGALINPDDVFNYAEIQIELFVAKLQIALSFLDLLPGIGKGAKALTGLGKRAAGEGLVRGLRTLAKDAVIAELENIAKLSIENFAKAFAHDVIKQSIENKLVDLAFSPIIDDLFIKPLEQELHQEGLL